jgi:hypothetical protein
MQNWCLDVIDTEDLADLIQQIEDSFAIELTSADFCENMTVEQLYQKIIAKMNQKVVNDCTTQQAFYQIRQILQNIVDAPSISPNTEFQSIFLKKERKHLIKKLEDRLNNRIKVLSAPILAYLGLSIGFLGLLISLFAQWFIGLYVALFLLLLCWLITKTVRVFRFRTVGDLAEHLAQFHYLQSRRNANTFNPAEIKGIVNIWFRDYFN